MVAAVTIQGAWNGGGWIHFSCWQVLFFNSGVNVIIQLCKYILFELDALQ